jgi:RNA polymerase sigma-70 factor (ECF subfamily)
MKRKGGNSPKASYDSFKTTEWGLIFLTREPEETGYTQALDTIIRRYWQPVYHYVLRRGCDQNRAKELVQEFFTISLAKRSFSRADPTRGKFRAFLLTCLKNFLKDEWRRAKRKEPPNGLLQVDEWAQKDGLGFQPAMTESPEDAFDRAWLGNLLLRVLGQLETEYKAKNQFAHYELFRRRVFEPMLYGGKPPNVGDIVRQFGLETKSACNCILSARRAFQRLLVTEIRVLALTEEGKELSKEEIKAELLTIAASFSH